ncbi:hypothetical protein T10_6172 [Trichinella papuae]|uniref:Uncharacterized protein n=1 Tax=Trichinella papuae TaxID=268474 RepID=A0A0V1M2K7_9BILA|nr:hypothetical protein T10_6172 [Trichinella papuae]
MVDRVKAAVTHKNGRGVVGEKTALGHRKCRGFCGESGTWRKNACKILGKGNGTGQKKSFMVDRVKASLSRKNGRGVGGEKTALGQAKCKAVFGGNTARGGKKASMVDREKTARGGEMRAKLFGGKLPHARQNSAGLDFVERKRHGAEKKPLWLVGYKPPWSLKMEGALVGRKRHWGTENVGEFLERKRHVEEKCMQSCLREMCPRPYKILVDWILWRGNITGQKKSLHDKMWGNFGGENGTWRKNACKAVWGKAAPGRTKVGGVDFVERKRLRAVKKPARGVLGRKRHVAEKVPSSLLGCKPPWAESFCGENGTLRKIAGKVVWGTPPQDGQNSGSVEIVEGKWHVAVKKPPNEETALGRKKCLDVCLGESCNDLDQNLVVGIIKNGKGVGEEKTTGNCIRPVEVKRVELLVRRRHVAEKKCRKLFVRKLPQAGQNSGGVDFVGRTLHEAEECVQRSLEERRHVPNEMMENGISGGGNCTERKKSLLRCWAESRSFPEKWKGS